MILSTDPEWPKRARECINAVKGAIDMAIDWNDPNLETKDGRKVKFLYRLKRHNRADRTNVCAIVDMPGNEFSQIYDDYGVCEHPSHSLHNPPKEEWVNVFRKLDGLMICSVSPFASKSDAEFYAKGTAGLYEHLATVRIR